ncbi:MAG: restriction endonuclease subunit S [Pseudomonadota bacterium]|nr:restriction endonuclease subunit S [Pseudomonadota bacterium]
MSNQINEGAARYSAEKHDQSRPELSGTQGTQSPQQLVTDHLDLWTSTVTQKSTSGRGRGSGKSSKIELTGIKKLRELILELAVRGKLVAQNPDDEPASKLLERIEAEKAQLIKGGKLKKQKPLAQVSEDEKPFELPEGWEWVRLGHIAQINPRNQVDDSTQVSFIPMASVSTRYSGSHDQEIKSWSEIKTGFTHFADGDVAIAKITPCFENSKAAIFSNLSNGVGAGTTELHVARPYGFLEQRFVLLVFKSPRYLIEGESQMTGSAGQKRVPKSYFEGTPIQLPPLTEQQRIVAKVDELMALCDQLEQQSEHQLDAHQQLTDTLLATLTESANAQELNDNWQRLASHFDLLFSGPMGAWAIDRLKDTILQLAVMGKLIPQNPDDEPASKLLERIEEEKVRLVKEGKIKKPKKLPPVSDNEKPFELPEGWEWSFWDNIALKIGDIDHKMPAAEKTGYPYISPRDFQGSNSINFENAKKISKKDFLALSRKIIPERGDIIFPRYGTIGDNRLVNTDIEFLASYSCCVIKTLRGFINADYQFITSISKTIKDQTDSAVNKTTQPNVGIKSIQVFLMPIPPLAEQHRIVAKVDELFALCDQLKDRLQQASETEQHLTNAIVEQALG